MTTPVDSLIKQFASAKVEVPKNEKEVSFVGLALTLDTEEDAAEIVKAINDCPGMTTLRLDGNTIGIPAAKAIAKALETQSDFKIALWKDMFTRRDKLEIPQALSHLSNGIMIANARLVVLDLSDNAFGPRGLVGIQKLLESPCCYTLQELHLNNNGLGISGAKLLSEAVCSCVENSRKNGTPMQLKIFVCGRNRLENEGAISVSKFLKEIGTLESIAMPQNGIYSPGIKHLAQAFAANPNLKVINLEDNSLTEAGAELIANCLPALPRLQMLNLGDCLVRTTGAVHLATSLENSCPDLRELHLGFNEIGYEGGEALTEAVERKDRLEVVTLNGNNFGEEGCDFIKDRFTQMGKIELLGSLSEDEGENDDEEDDDEDDQFDEDDDEDNDVHNVSNKSTGDKKNTTHQSPMFKVSAADFLKNPTPEALVALHKSNENFSEVLPAEPTLKEYTDLFFKISLAVQPEQIEAKAAACKYADDFLAKAYGLGSKDATDFNNIFLVSIGLIKDEGKKPKEGLDISGTLLVLEHAVRQTYFHASTRALLQFFLGRPLQYVTASEKTKHLLMQTLYQI